MPANTDEISRVQEFLDALTELSRRTGVVVWGCNCHDSPALLVDAEEFRGPWDADGWYVVDYNPDVEPDSPCSASCSGLQSSNVLLANIRDSYSD